MTITWLGHACFMLESGGYRVILDPFEGVSGFRDIEGEAEAVYCSHGHHDHCYTEKLTIHGGPSPFTVREIPSFHDDKGGTLRGANTIRVLTAGGITAAHLGDLGHALSPGQLAALGRVDVLLIPVGGTYTLDTKAAKAVAEAIRPRLTVPMHYRRGGQGYEVLETAEEFAAQYAPDAVRWLETNTLTLTEEYLDRGGVVFFSI